MVVDCLRMNASEAETLVQEQYRMVYRYMRSILRPGAPVEDLVQQVFLIALRKLQTDDEAPRRVGAWLRGIARNVVLKSLGPAARLREAVRERILGLGGEVASDYDAHDRQALRDCIARLDGNERELLHMRYVADLRSGEIAGRTEGTRDGVRARLHRIRLKLRRCLKRKGVFG